MRGYCKKAHNAYAEICRVQHLVSIMTKAYQAQFDVGAMGINYRTVPRGKNWWSSPYSMHVRCYQRHSLCTDVLRCTWRALPADFPAWSTVYGYFRARRARWYLAYGTRAFFTNG